ncbi:hypothetical protein BT96DRAFT_994134 [Gymnopus androsaceus JB14]|uniref:Uncharacterized protein n=1 Tax=Gymnopus androsaceus JB14 TaxID=1447944 RepID=A0A6A4HQY7_9AGAR|nr:hypothetical protein BT96DRAFT_994134 [Gymnopus androsaceus JB14]
MYFFHTNSNALSKQHRYVLPWRVEKASMEPWHALQRTLWIDSFSTKAKLVPRYGTFQRPNDEEEGLAYGTEHGYLAVWRKNKEGDGMQFTETFCDRLTGGKDGDEISAIAYDTNSGQIAVVHRAEAIHRFILDVGMIPRIIKSVTIAKHWPQAVAFGQVGVRGPELWSFGREDGICPQRRGKILKSKPTGMVIGHAVLNTKDDAIILDDVAQGVALNETGRH